VIPSAANMIPAAELPDEALEYCDNIAYQYTALVQSHAALLVLTQDGTILQASTNTGSILGRHCDDILHTGFADARLVADAEPIMRAIAGEHQAGPVLLDDLSTNAGVPLIGRLTRVPGRVHLELEFRDHPADITIEDPARRLSELADAVASNDSVEQAAEVITSHVRGFLGYDRCMIYRFDQQFNGEVIGESRSQRTHEAFLGLRFPTRDIPRSARNLFATTHARVTVDQNADCAEIMPLKDPITHEHVDLSAVRARGAAGSCQIYYQNMGTRATLVIPIIAFGRLWGLLSCHHQSPARPSPKLDHYFDLLSVVIASAIERRLTRDANEAHLRTAAIRDTLAATDPVRPEWPDVLESHAHAILRVVDAEGFIMRIGGRLMTSGTVPSEAEAHRLIDKLLGIADGSTFATNQLPSVVPELADLSDVATGVILTPLVSDAHDAAVWLRPELSQTVRWAGSPTENVRWTEEGKPRLTPRSSFALYKTTTRNVAARWEEAEPRAAAAMGMQIGLLTLTWRAAQASRAKNDFLANMSHEVRTPMTAILGYADLIGDTDGTPAHPDDVHAAIDAIRNNADHLMTVINDILDMSKIEAGRLSVESISTSPARVANEAADLVVNRAESKGIRLSVTTDHGVPDSIQSDPTRLKQILLNLLSNAIKFTESGEVSIDVRTTKAGNAIAFAISDTGIGMNPMELQQVRAFSPFNQADGTTTRRFGGTGLGLSISKSLATLLGGDLTADSREGSGSTFTLTIPNRPVDEPEDNATSVGDAPSDMTLPLRGIRVLVAEDSIDNQRLLEHFLTKAGAECVLARDGAVALDQINRPLLSEPGADRRAFDLILMDMQMPRVDGYEATRLLRDRGVKTPIIAITAHALTGDRERCLEVGCDDYISKPVDFASLIEICTRHAHRTAQTHT